MNTVIIKNRAEEFMSRTKPMFLFSRAGSFPYLARALHTSCCGMVFGGFSGGRVSTYSIFPQSKQTCCGPGFGNTAISHHAKLVQFGSSMTSNRIPNWDTARTHYWGTLGHHWDTMPSPRRPVRFWETRITFLGKHLRYGKRTIQT